MQTLLTDINMGNFKIQEGGLDYSALGHILQAPDSSRHPREPTSFRMELPGRTWRFLSFLGGATYEDVEISAFRGFVCFPPRLVALSSENRTQFKRDYDAQVIEPERYLSRDRAAI